MCSISRDHAPYPGGLVAVLSLCILRLEGVKNDCSSNAEEELLFLSRNGNLINEFISFTLSTAGLGGVVYLGGVVNETALIEWPLVTMVTNKHIINNTLMNVAQTSFRCCQHFTASGHSTEK